MNAASAPVDFWTALRRGWRGRCPRCGEGSFTILAVGHIVVPLVLALERYGDQPPLWFHAALWLPLSVLLALILLPRVKGTVIALLWTHRIADPKPEGLGPST